MLHLKGFAGLSSRLAPFLIGDDQAQALENVSTRNGTLEKRPGNRRRNRTAAAGGKILGIHPFDHDDGTHKRIVKSGSKFYSMSDSWALSQLFTGSVNTALPSEALSFRNLLYIADVDQFFVYDKVSGVFGYATIPAPPNAPLVYDGSGNVPFGTYRYAIVPYSSYLLQEGPQSPETSYTGSTPVIDEQLQGVVSSWSGIWNKFRIYRTVKGGTELLFHSEHAFIFLPLLDSVPDTSLGAAIGSTSRIDIPDAIDVEERNDRTFLIRKNDPSIYFSDPGRPNEFPAENNLDALGKSDLPQALFKLSNALFVIGHKSIYICYGDRESNYSLSSIARARGTVSRPSVRVYNEVAYFLSDKAICSFDGLGPSVDISTGDILPILQNEIDYAASENFSAWINPIGEEYCLSYRRKGQSINDRVLRYHIPTRRWFVDTDLYVAAGGVFENADGLVRPFVGNDLGHVSEDEQEDYYNGVADGVLAGSATGGSATTLTSSGFSTTGDGLAGFRVEVTHANGLRETSRISSNSSGQLTFAAISQAVASGDAFVVSPIRLSWTTKRVGENTANRFKEVEIHFEEQGHSTPLEISFSVDGGSFSTPAQLSMNGIVFGDTWVGRFGRRVAAKIECGGSNAAVAVAEVTIFDEVQEN